MHPDKDLTNFVTTPNFAGVTRPCLKPKFKAGTVKGGEQWRFFSVVSQLWRR